MSSKEVEVSNFDVLRLAIKKELKTLSLGLSKSLKEVGSPKMDMNVPHLPDLISVLIKLSELVSLIDFKPEFKIPDITIPDIKIPDFNIPEIKVPSIYVPPAEVTVNPEVNIDVRGIINALDNLKYLSDRPNKPIAVRMSDGQKFIKAVQDLQKATENLGVVYSGSSGLSTDDMRSLGLAVTGIVGDGSKTVTTAGTRVQLSSSSVSCRRVKIVALAANTGTIWVGGSTVASGRGEPLVAQQGTDWIETNNVSNVWIDSTVNAEGVSFIYV